MESVWQELSKHQREEYVTTAKPFHPATLPQAVESWADMAAALRSRAAEYGELGGAALAAKYEKRALAAEERHRARASGASSDAERHEVALAIIFTVAVALYREGLKTVTQRELDQHVEALRSAGRNEIAAAYERHAEKPAVARFFVERKRTNARLEAFIEGLAGQTNPLFGKPLYGVIATIANIAFERSDLDRQHVRAILKTRRNGPAPS
jgi:hypothetical protein